MRRTVPVVAEKTFSGSFVVLFCVFPGTEMIVSERKNQEERPGLALKNISHKVYYPDQNSDFAVII